MTWLFTSEEVKLSEVTQSCPTLCDPMDCSLPGFSVHGVFQARVLDWVAISFSRGSSLSRDWTQVSCIAGRRFNLWVTREGHGGQDIGTLATDLAMKNQGWLLGLAGLITLQSSPVPQFKSIYSSVFSIFSGSTPISIVVYWKNHRFDYMDLCQQSDFSAY